VLMIENHRSGLVWALMRGCAPLLEGLRRAGFEGGWLDGASGSRASGAAPVIEAAASATATAAAAPAVTNDQRRSTCNSE